MGRPAINWTTEKDLDLAILNATHTPREIAALWGISAEIIRKRLYIIGVKPLYRKGDHKSGPAPRSFIKPRWPEGMRFEDHPDGDRDKHLGRVPGKQYRYSLLGNSSAMMVG